MDYIKEEEGVLVPLLARPNPNGDGFEIIAGHRRKEASKWAGIDVFAFVKKEYDVEPDYPFNKDLETGVLRHKDTRKPSGLQSNLAKR